MKIYKYELNYTDEQTIDVKVIKPLSIQKQNETVYLWAIVDEYDAETKSTIRMYGTGATIDALLQQTHIASLQIGAFVFHYFIDGIF